MYPLVIAALFCAIAVLAYFAYVFRWTEKRAAARHVLIRREENPILSPVEHSWENAAVFNPGAVLMDGKVHLFYRALGEDGISRIGYAVSDDGIAFERFADPAFALRLPSPGKFRNPFAEGFRYDPGRFASGGGWGGSEDPRVVVVDGRLYMTFAVFESWESLRLALASIPVSGVAKREWRWEDPFFISPAGEVNKNWVMFPEKIRGKFAILHALTPEVLVSYADSPDEWREQPIESDNRRTGRAGHWDAFVRGAAAPPLKTRYGWLLLYHAMDPASGPGYKVGAMLLDLDDPTKVLYRSTGPILEPQAWYENDWKPGVVYASGAVVKDGTLYVYYGGGDKRVNVATAPLETFLQDLMKTGAPKLAPER